MLKDLKISPHDAHIKVAGDAALLVCTRSDEKCRKMLLEGALLLSEFRSREHVLEKDHEIIFYCG